MIGVVIVLDAQAVRAVGDTDAREPKAWNLVGAPIVGASSKECLVAQWGLEHGDLPQLGVARDAVDGSANSGLDRAGVRSRDPSAEGRGSVEVNRIHFVHQLLPVEKSGRIGGEQFGDEAILCCVEGRGVRADQEVRLIPEWAVLA